MNPVQKGPKNIDEYIAGYPPDVQAILRKFRVTIRDAMPDAEETIKYGMPHFTQKGKGVIAFAAWKKHIAIYTVPAGTEKFQREIAPYRAAKSTARFPLNKPIPYPLISQLAKFKLKEHLANVAAKAKKK